MAVCIHLDQIRLTGPPAPVEGCKECLATGERPAASPCLWQWHPPAVTALFDPSQSDAFGWYEDVPLAVELRWRPWVSGGGILLGRCDSGDCGVQGSAQRGQMQVAVDPAELLAASPIPAATQRSTICPSRQRLTLAA